MGGEHEEGEGERRVAKEVRRRWEWRRGAREVGEVGEEVRGGGGCK